MNYLVTGAAGFVGGHLIKELTDQGHNVFALVISEAEKNQLDNNLYSDILVSDILEINAHIELISEWNLDGVYHLAAQASVFKSWQNPLDSYRINILGTQALVDLLNRLETKPKLLFASSSEVYGQLKEKCCESSMVNPINPYALSKATAETICSLSYDNFIIARQFSIIGVGHADMYAIPNFCKQVANMKKHNLPKILSVGNVEVFRNFVSLPDVINAYHVLMTKGEKGNVYNIASDTTMTIKDLLNMLREISSIDFEIVIDPDRFRPVDSAMLDIDYGKLSNLGWQPEVSIKESLKKVYESFL